MLYVTGRAPAEDDEPSLSSSKHKGKKPQIAPSSPEVSSSDEDSPPQKQRSSRAPPSKPASGALKLSRSEYSSSENVTQVEDDAEEEQEY